MSAGGPVEAARALVDASPHLQESPAGEQADLTFVAIDQRGPVDWERVAQMSADPMHGEIVLCVEEAGSGSVLPGISPLVAHAPVLTVPATERVVPPASGHRFPLLSRRESRVVALIAAGSTNEEIAQELMLSPNTVKTYIRTAYRKMGVTRRSQAVAWALKNG